MILNHVADDASLVVKGAAALYSEVLRHSDLHAFDIVAVPKRLHKRVRKTKDQHVVDGLFPKVVVYAKDGGFVERSKQDAIEIPC